MLRVSENNKCNQCAFTLIEVMLVLAILAGVGVAGVALHRQYVLNVKVDKTILQVQQWLQGAQAFYVMKGHWPSDVERKEFLDQYLPVHSEKNPWGFPYKIAFSRAENLFGVKFEVPDYAMDQMTHQSMIAERIAGQLPNAEVQDDHFVYADITVPSQALAQRTGTNIISIQQVNLSATQKPLIDMPTEEQCPSDTNEAKAYFALGGFDFNRNNPLGKSQFISYVEAGLKKENKIGWRTNLMTQAYLSNYNNQTGNVLVIVTCEPKKKQEIVENTNIFIF